MDELTRNGAWPHDGRPGSLGELIHAAVRRMIEVAVDEELTAALGARRYELGSPRRGYRNGRKPRTVTGPTGPLIGLVVSGQIRLRRLDGWRQIPAMLREHHRPAA